MDSFPYESWEEALEAADGAAGYFTFGPGGNTAIVIITIIGIVLAAAWIVHTTIKETKDLDEHARRLSEKWGI